jgi:hypothetical protein
MSFAIIAQSRTHCYVENSKMSFEFLALEMFSFFVDLKKQQQSIGNCKKTQNKIKNKKTKHTLRF